MDNLLQLIKDHQNIEELSEILKIRYLNNLLAEKGLPSLDSERIKERYYYYNVATDRRGLSENQKLYILSLLDSIGCSSDMD